MTPNNLTLEEAQQLLKDWFESEDHKRDTLGIATIDCLIKAARTVQRAEDNVDRIKDLDEAWDCGYEKGRKEQRAEMIENFKRICLLKDNGDVKYFKPEFIEDLEPWEDYLPQKILAILTPEAPLSDNQKVS